MFFEKVDVKLPEDILDLYGKISSIQPNSCIAGGFLSDLYMNRPYKDIDIFILSSKKTDEKIRKLVESISTFEKKSEFSPSYEYQMALKVETRTYKSYNIQLVFTPYGNEIVNYFDFSFREFIFVKGSCWASKDALEDIQKKRLRFGVSRAPLVVLTRYLQFSTRYGFKMDALSEQKFYSLLNCYSISQETFNEYLANKTLDHEIISRLQEFFLTHSSDKNILSIRTFLDYEAYLFYMRKGLMNRFELEYIFLESFKDIKTFEFHFQKNFYPAKIKNIKDSLFSLYKRDRLRILSSFPEFSPILQKEMNRLDLEPHQAAGNLYNVFSNHYKDLYRKIPFYDWVRALLDAVEIFSCANAKEFKENKMKVEVSKKDVLFPDKNFNFNDYLKGLYISYKFGKFGKIVVKKKKRNVFVFERYPIFLKRHFRNIIAKIERSERESE